MVSASVLVGASVAGIAVVGYCIYFDRKRRSDPLYKQKIRERRAKQKAQKATQHISKADTHDIPNFQDPTELQAYLFSQIQQGEEYLASGDMENAADSFCNAITVCDQPQVLLMALQQSTPPQVFAMIRERMPAALQRLKRALGSAAESEHPPMAMMEPLAHDENLIDEDLE